MTQLEKLVASPVIAAWLLGKASRMDLQLAHLSGQIDDLMFDTLLRCEGWETDHDRMLLLGNLVLTPTVIREMVRLGRIPRLLGDELLAPAQVIHQAVTSEPPNVRSLIDGSRH